MINDGQVIQTNVASKFDDILGFVIGWNVHMQNQV